ncbi:hypothetical protein HO173_012819 [Letharia columbiana]|uniref:Uncharacterized protein n=1 Tax=Letharia columbiana TaxID=112416 RepID=A0A8H6FEX4_9LECA|nr:uncharacterized protein HO173_012819 [Letharia columbiana]KAF6225334.1 hypothetical protein HO173_012819 [Letharia columbiana]
MDSKDKKPDSSETPPDTMTLHQLKDMLNKGVEPTDTDERIEQFVSWRIQDYNENKWESLSDIFAEEFRLFAKEDFEALSKEQQYGLRNCLRNNGVYVKKGRGVSMAESLANVVQEETPWPLDDENRPPPKHQYPPQQQPYQPYRPENTVPLPRNSQFSHSSLGPTNQLSRIPLQSIPPHSNCRGYHSSPPSPYPSDGPPRQPQLQSMQSIQQQQPEDTTALLSQDFEIKEQAVAEDIKEQAVAEEIKEQAVAEEIKEQAVAEDIKEQAVAEDIKEQAVAEDSLKSTTKKSITSSSPVNTSQLSAVLRPRTISILREPTFSLSTARIQHTSNLAPPFASQHAYFLAPLFASQHGHFLASWLASPLGYIRDTERRKAIGQG